MRTAPIPSHPRVANFSRTRYNRGRRHHTPDRTTCAVHRKRPPLSHRGGPLLVSGLHQHGEPSRAAVWSKRRRVRPRECLPPVRAGPLSRWIPPSGATAGCERSYRSVTFPVARTTRRSPSQPSCSAPHPKERPRSSQPGAVPMFGVRRRGLRFRGSGRPSSPNRTSRDARTSRIEGRGTRTPRGRRTRPASRCVRREATRNASAGPVA